MSIHNQTVFKACQQCRKAKVKCDLARPICGRCSRRGTLCTGYSDDIFRDQSRSAGEAVQRRLRTTARDSSSQTGTSSATGSDDDATPVAPWLNAQARSDLPRTVTGDADVRTVDFFFSNWIMYPCNHKISPGHLQDLPALYEHGAPGSAIRLAIEAMAYGDLPDQHAKARRKYGAALGRVRAVITDAQQSTTDALLAALLVIDNFELMHHDRSEPLGPHSVGLKYLLRARGDDQLFNRRGFSLWRVAHHRLQARQILLREEPLPEQAEWVNKLDGKYPDLHITRHIFEISKICAQADMLLKQSSTASDETLQSAADFLRRGTETIRECDQWMDKISDQWKHKRVVNNSSFEILKDLPNLSIHHDIWVTYISNFHIASRIAAREAFLEVITSPAYRLIFNQKDMEETVSQSVNDIKRFSKWLLETMPQLLGFVDHNGEPRSSQRDITGSKNGKGLGGFFALYTLWIIHACKNAPAEHKSIAANLLSWIHTQNSYL